MILTAAIPARRGLDRPPRLAAVGADLAVAGLVRAGPLAVAGRLGVNVGIVQQFAIGAVAFPVRARAVEEQQVDLEVEQVRDREEHLFLQRRQRIEQEVHPWVAGVVAQRRQPVDEHPVAHPRRPGQLRQRRRR